MTEVTEGPVEALGDEIAALAAQISAATCRWLGLIARFDELCGWAYEGASSCAAWVSWRCGVAPVTAREHVRVAHRLTEFPLIQEAFSHGELSYSKVRALTRIDRIRDEAELLDLARHADASQLERIVAAFRGVTTEQADRAHAARSLDLIDDGDGTMVIRGRLPAELGAVLLAAVRTAEAQLAPDDPEALGADAPRTPAAARRADALVLLARTAALAGATAAPRPMPAPGLAPSAVEVTVHVDASVLTDAGDLDTGTETGVVGEGQAVAAETVRRLCCDAGIVPVVVDGAGAVLDVGRRTRAIPPSIRRALAVRDGGCRFPGCARTRWLQAHHVEHWAHGGQTKLSNLVLLCHHHHQLVHEGGWQLIVSGDGPTFDALAPEGHHVPAIRPNDRIAADGPLIRLGEAEACRPDAASLYPRSAGAPWDLGMAVDAILAWTAPHG